MKTICIVLLLFVGVAAFAVDPGESPAMSYRKLLEKFPEDQQGLGLDTFFNSIEPQPMTYALVLSSESIHYKKIASEETRRRIRKAAKWLIENSDADHDGKPGWGLPQAWDAFSDGTTNAPNTSYTITTAIVLNGFLDTLSISDFWTKAEQREMEKLIGRVLVRWCEHIWSEGHGGGFFWYSPNRHDAIFSVNAPAMFLGATQRFLSEHGTVLRKSKRKLVQARADELAKAIVATAHLRNGCPFWDYAPKPNPLPKISPNDLVHQAYILWGTELYRKFGGTIKIPWTREQAAASLDRFVVNGKILRIAKDEPSLPAGETNRSSPLWGAGMALAFESEFGNRTSAGKFYKGLIDEYHSPELRQFPNSPDERFYPRHASHALLGLAYFSYGSN
jgi:hypothetical protein